MSVANHIDFHRTIAERAGQRWLSRSSVREENRANGAMRSETPDRLAKRMKRLEMAALEQMRAPKPATEAALRMIERVGLERVIGKADFLGVNFLELALAVSRFVGRINIRNQGRRTVGYGTGFMVSPRLLLTNNHVLGSRDDARWSEVEFDYQYDRYGRMLPVVPFRFNPDAFFLTSAELDYTLIAVAEQSIDGRAIREYGWSRLIGEQGKAILQDELNIIQHPKGEPKQIVLRSNRLVDLFEDFAHYETDTEPGSSGSPVYNDQWEVVALHHSGVPEYRDGKLVDVDGNLWRSGDGPDRISWIANEGIRVSSMVKDMTSRPLTSADQDRMLDEMLNREPPHPFEVIERRADGQKKTQPTGTRHEGAVAVRGEGSGVTITIPLTVTVSLGGTSVQSSSVGVDGPGIVPTPPSGSDGEGPVDGGPTPDTGSPAAGGGSGVEGDSGYIDAVADLDRGAERPYYDEDADAADRNTYYGSLPDEAGELGPEELFRRLSELVTSTHRNRPRYKPAQHVYPWIDLHEENGQRFLRSIYTGDRYDPRDFIREDFEIDRRRARMMESFLLESRTADPAQLEAVLEASFPYNCEHVVPQSWFDKKEPMKGDLHHLFSCEGGCNSFRGNTPYFDFPDFEEVVRESCGKREGNRFEPSQGKGAVARATLYFLLRYPGLINNSAGEYTEDRIRIILAWHQANPVSLYEKHRNAAIWEVQGNRNPLIDFPEWGNAIGFLHGLGG